jgi:hypothetical protein
MLHNFAEDPVETRISVPGLVPESSLRDLFTDETIEISGGADGYEVAVLLEGYGFRWLRNVLGGDVRRY